MRRLRLEFSKRCSICNGDKSLREFDEDEEGMPKDYCRACDPLREIKARKPKPLRTRKMCKVCFDLPHARAKPKCRACGFPHAEEKIEKPSERRNSPLAFV